MTKGSVLKRESDCAVVYDQRTVRKGELLGNAVSWSSVVAIDYRWYIRASSTAVLEVISND